MHLVVSSCVDSHHRCIKAPQENYVSYDSASMTAPPSNILVTIARGFDDLKRDVTVALRTQLGDARQLDERIGACCRFAKDIELVCAFIVSVELSLLI